MSFLTPLYIAGLAAIALPLVFHLIRRMPRGQTPFSSLMFLTPSPPRITRRSRLDQLLLLFLRALALTLLALAFARPFFREAAQLGFDSLAQRRIAILVDVSASMRRADLWRQAQERVSEVLADLRPGDQAAVFAFDQEVATLLDFDDPSQVEPRRRAAVIKRLLAERSPTWRAGDLGNALAIVAERLDALDRGRADEAEMPARIVLLSDFQQGSRLESLQGYEWPSRIEVEVHTVAPKDPTNAGVRLVGGGWDQASAGEESSEESSAAAPVYRVRIGNAPDSEAEQFQLAWLDAGGQTIGAPLKTYVPPGQSRIVTVPEPAREGPLRLELRGDAHDFDNTVYVAPRKREELRVVYLGDDAADDPQGARYYIERAFPDSPHRRIRVIAPQEQEPLAAPGDTPPRLVIVAGSLTASRTGELLRYLERGGRALFATAQAPASALPQLLNKPALTATESDAGEYALLGAIDFSHVLLSPFADPRYSDFTKILFWKHRRIAWESPEEDPPGDLSVLARFDNGDPALLERRIGPGRLYVLATTWRPDDSQLARSSKFVPLLLGMLGDTSSDRGATVHVGRPLPLDGATSGEAVSFQKPDGTTLLLAAGAEEFTETDQPGVYSAGEQKFVVQLDPSESETAPRSPEDLEQFGVRLTGAAKRQAEAERQRHLRDVELEGRQKIWRWLLAAALAALICETWLAGRQSRPTSQGSEVRSQEAGVRDQE